MTPTPAGIDAAAHREAALDQAARIAAYERMFRGVMTEVISQEDLAGWL